MPLFWSRAVVLIFFTDEISENAQSRHFLQTVISPALDKIANTKVHKLDAAVPLISITVGDSEKMTHVDVSMNRIGELKTEFMQALFKFKPLLYPFMWLLVRWARCVGIVKSGQDTESLIATAEFYILVIRLMQFNKMEEITRIKAPVSNCLFILPARCRDISRKNSD